MKKIHIKKIILSLTVIFFILPVVAYGGDYLAIDTFQSVDSSTPTKLIAGIYNISIGIGAMLAVIMIVKGGIKYTVSEAIGSKEDAKKDIEFAIWGLILLLGSYIILRTINVDLVDVDLSLGTPGVQQDSGAAAPAIPESTE